MLCRHRLLPLVLGITAAVTLHADPVRQRLPRADVIGVPSKSEGLCLSNLFQSNMVLQRDKPVSIWGWAAPSENVTLTFGGQSVNTQAAADGAWKVTLAPLTANAISQQLVVTGSTRSLILENVLVGDVWVLGGQSNMEFELAKVENGPLEIVSANYPEIRILTVPYAVGPETQSGFPRLHEWSGWFNRHFRKGDWDPCSPEIARDLSAIGYVFARRVHMASGIPIGVIDASRGGTTVEAWTPQTVLRSIEGQAVQAKLSEWDAKVSAWDPEKDLEKRIAQHRQAMERMQREGKEIPADQTPPGDLLPGPIADPNYPGNSFAGMISPLAGLSIKGALFHQGYNNAFDGSQGAQLYLDVFPAMIHAWRGAFNDPQLPFGILSLCTEGDPQTLDNYVEKMFDAGIYIREAHYKTFLGMVSAGDKFVGYASTYDLRRRWYHPQVKIPAGERTARWALATLYGFEREISWRPPLLLGMEVADGSIVLTFDSEVADPEDGAILGFAIAGYDRRFQPASALPFQEGLDERNRPRLNRKKLVLHSPLVAEPIHFRYAWGRNPLANLQVVGNKDIPLATQRSDDWPMEQVPLGILNDEPTDRLSGAQRGRILTFLRSEDLRRRLYEAEKLIEATTPQS